MVIAHGALFGVVAGAALSVAGGVGAALTGYGLGRFAGRPLVRRVCSAAELDRAARLVERWGVLAVVVTRPVPLLAETVAVAAGAQRLGPLRTAAASVLGLLPAAAPYAAAGAFGATGPTRVGAFVLVLAVAGAVWLSGRPPVVSAPDAAPATPARRRPRGRSAR